MKNQDYNKPVTECYYCSGNNLKHHSNATYWKEYKLHFVECSECGLIFADPMPSVKVIIEGNRALNIHHVSRGTLSQYRGGKELTLFLNKYKPKGVMLDVGCAEGFLLKGVEDNSDWRAEGIDIIESSVEFANKRLGVTVYLGTIETLEDKAGRYDFLRLNNVIEHVQDPVKFLKISNGLIKKGGLIYCSTPNGFQDGQVLKEANKRGIEINLLENHFFYYHPKTLSSIFKSTGFKIKKAYCEDIKHSLNNFGLLPWFRYSRKTHNFSLSSFKNRTNMEFNITGEELESLKKDPSLKMWRIRFKNIEKKIFRIHLPSYIPIGHQQFLLAEKI